MRLPLMMALMPRQDVQHVNHHQFAFLEPFGNRPQVFVAKAGQRRQQVLARLGEQAAN